MAFDGDFDPETVCVPCRECRARRGACDVAVLPGGRAFPAEYLDGLSGSPERHGKGEGPGGCETVVEEPYLRFEQLAFRPVELRDAGAVLITKVMTTCECTSAVWDKAPLLPGRRSRIEVTYEAERDGVFFRKLFIYHAGAASPFEIAIEGVGEE